MTQSGPTLRHIPQRSTLLPNEACYPFDEKPEAQPCPAAIGDLATRLIE
jgi:hypothetical protein